MVVSLAGDFLSRLDREADCILGIIPGLCQMGELLRREKETCAGLDLEAGFGYVRENETQFVKPKATFENVVLRQTLCRRTRLCAIGKASQSTNLKTNTDARLSTLLEVPLVFSYIEVLLPLD